MKKIVIVMFLSWFFIYKPHGPDIKVIGPFKDITQCVQYQIWLNDVTPQTRGKTFSNCWSSE